ncbi:MAG: 50S ribosomal protein L29 [Puniceicoccales bacterium]|jgi:large subunit ribosomal protein L29|nr:50S ribosomal protein L29 [Puniceicoccales bacterium]
MTDNVNYRELSVVELGKKLAEAHDEMFQLRLKKSSSQLENSAFITKTRKKIAKIKTFLRQKSCKSSQMPTC